MVRVRVTFLLHNVTISGSCTYQVLTGPRVGSLLFHMSVFYWHTCHGWITCHFFIGPCFVFLLVHVALFDHESQRYLSTFYIFIQPRGFTTSFHVSYFNSPRVVSWLFHMLYTGSSMCRILIAHVSCPGYFTCHALVHPHVTFFFDQVACPGSTSCSTINSS